MSDVVVYSTRYCAYCGAAKALLDSLGIPYREVALDTDPELRMEMAERFNWRTVPMIVVDDRLIGGYTDLRAMHQRGELRQLLGQPSIDG